MFCSSIAAIVSSCGHDYLLLPVSFVSFRLFARLPEWLRLFLVWSKGCNQSTTGYALAFDQGPLERITETDLLIRIKGLELLGNILKQLCFWSHVPGMPRIPSTAPARRFSTAGVWTDGGIPVPPSEIVTSVASPSPMPGHVSTFSTLQVQPPPVALSPSPSPPVTPQESENEEGQWQSFLLNNPFEMSQDKLKTEPKGFTRARVSYSYYSLLMSCHCSRYDEQFCISIASFLFVFMPVPTNPFLNGTLSLSTVLLFVPFAIVSVCYCCFSFPSMNQFNQKKTIPFMFCCVSSVFFRFRSRSATVGFCTQCRSSFNIGNSCQPTSSGISSEGRSSCPCQTQEIQ